MKRPPLPLVLRLWLAVVGTVAMLALIFGWLWSLNAEPPALRQLLVRDASGRVIGVASAPPVRVPGQGLEIPVLLDSGERISVQIPPRPRRPGEPPPPRPWLQRPGALLWLLGFVAVAVAVGAWPVMRHLTRRLERLREGAERWGAGDLSVRVPEEGGDEVAAVARRFNEAAARIEALVGAHKALLANASHELRSPLARIRMALELGGLDREAARAEILRSIGELDQLVEEVLLASRLDARGADVGSIESVDVAGLAAEEAARTGAELTLNAPAGQLVADARPRLLSRLLRNLLENARRHGADEVRLGLAREGDWLLLTVDDNGPGVPAAERERIFEPFYRLAGASERDGGVGLGLALVRGIARRHGGDAHCEAAPGGGARFVVRWPVRAVR